MSTHQQHTTAAEDRVSWNQLFTYGMGGLIPIALFNIAQQLIGLLGNISLGLNALLLGTIMIIPRLWEAFSDPLIGHMSDHTRTHWGRRRPFILVGGITVALGFVALWWIPNGPWIHQVFPTKSAYDWFQLVYLLLGALIFYTACNTFEIPHGALGMEMSADPHERTRLFSAKSFLGNLFAMGTPWLLALASLELFRGPGGTLNDGMRYVSLLIAAALVPMAFWWFASLREPGAATAKQEKKSAFWHDMRVTVSNKTFLILTGVIFTLAMGFNFVGNFANYITIFYLYGGDAVTSTGLLGWAGTVWAVTGLVAVFPLNWLGKRLGKRNTLLIAILLMCAAQLSKIVCYQPGTLFQFDLPAWLMRLLPETYETITFQGPYLILVPTVLLSAGMLMFFTLGSSMVGDVCDEDELYTGTRSEGTYYSVFWWFIKMGTAFASLVTGALLVFTSFDETQNVIVDTLNRNLSVMKADIELWTTQEVDSAARARNLDRQLEDIILAAEKARAHFIQRLEGHHEQTNHVRSLIEHVDSISADAKTLRAKSASLAAIPDELIRETNKLLQQSEQLRLQSPTTLFRLRLVEIGLPLLMSVVSILLTLRYPLTEARCYEIKEALKQRRAAVAT